MTRPEADRWLHRIYFMLKEAEDDSLVKVRLNRDLCNYGEVDFCHSPAVMTVNHTRRPFVSTIVHECIHLCDVEMSERRVLDLERELMSALSDRQLANLLKRVARLI